MLLAACALLLGPISVQAENRTRTTFTTSGPRLDPMHFFTGRTRSLGVFEDRGGNPTKEVRTITRGRVVSRELHVEQDLFIGNEPPQRRSWRMRRVDADCFEATANDIIGTARGVASGNHFRWTFTLALKPGNPLSHVRMAQDMYLQPKGRTLIIRTRIKSLASLSRR
jgi:hypothetical protein